MSELYTLPPDYGWAVRIQKEFYRTHNGGREGLTVIALLEQHRKRLGMEAPEFAKHIGESPVNYWKWRTGYNVPHNSTLRRLEKKEAEIGDI